MYGLERSLKSYGTTRAMQLALSLKTLDSPPWQC